jgi:hypothetical protein
MRLCITLPPATEIQRSFYHFPSTVYSDVSSYLKQHDGCRDRTVFVSWPRSMEWMKYYEGDTIIWIGEREGGMYSF